MPGKKKEKSGQIEDFKEFHKLVPEIVEKINRDENLAIRALVNPLLAFEELGYDLSPEVQKQVERFLRFGPKKRKKLNELEKDIHKLAGGQFEVDSPDDIEEILFKKLKLKKPKGMKKLKPLDPVLAGREFTERKQLRWSDPLESLKKAHPLMPSLLAYRELHAKTPGFASRSLYEELQSGKRKLPITKVKVRFPEHHEEVRNA